MEYQLEYHFKKDLEVGFNPEQDVEQAYRKVERGKKKDTREEDDD